MMDKDRALQLARDAFSGSTSYFDANIRPEVERDLRQFQSKHPTGSKYLSDNYKGRSRFFRPKTRSMVRSAEASVAEAFFSTTDAVSIEPVRDTDEMAMATAEIMRELMQYRLTASDTHGIPWFKIVCGAFQDAEVQGVVISHQGWDKAKDKPDVELIPRENFRFDPAASWLDPVGTSPYLIWMRPMRVRDVKKRMNEGKWIKRSDQEILSAAKRYSDTTRMLREGDRTDSADQVTSINDFTIVWVHQNIVVDDDGADVMYYTLGTDFVLSNPEPLDVQYAHGRRPFVIGQVVIETHKNDPAGEVRLVRDVQAESNEIANQRIDNVKFAMNKRYFVKRNRQVDIRSLTRNVPSSVTLMTDIEGDVKVINTPDVTSSSYQEQDRINMDFDEISGNMSQSSVQANRHLNETVGGMEILANDANKVRAYAIKTFIETWAEPVLRQIVLLEQCYETSVVLLELAAGKSEMFQRLGMDAVSDDLMLREVKLSVNVGMNATSPTQKINNLLTGISGVKGALSDGVLERYGIEPQEVIKEIFGALGYKNGGRFFSLDGKEDPRITELQRKADELQQALNAKHPPELLAAQVREIEARIKNINSDTTGKNVTAMFSATNAANLIAQNPAISVPADKMLMSSGFEDADAAPGIPGIAPGTPAIEGIPENTSPNFPPTPDSGMNAGIETGIAAQQEDEGLA